MAKHVVVLGGGATGEAFIGQLRRLDKDARMTLVEQELVGGECSYWACIPSKTLLRPLEVYYRARIAPGAAEALDGVDIARVFWWRDQTAEKDDTSQAEWVAKQGAELVRGTGRVVGPGRLKVDQTELDYDALLISTGSLPAKPPIEGLEKSGPWGSREATSTSSVPKSLIIIGGGAVGCEMAQFYGRIGSHVTLIQSGDYLLPRIDRDAGDLLAGKFREEGIDVRLNGRATRVEGGHGSPYRLQLGDEELEAEALLIATGRTPNVEGFGFDELGVKVGREGIEVDDRLGAAENVWAAGDVTGVALFTHVGKYQARVAAANVAGVDRRADYRAIPAAVFTDPQIATVGDTSGEGAAVSKWRVDKVSRAATFHRPKQPGFVKLFAHKKRGVLVGAVVVGPEAGEWMGQLTLAIRAEVPVELLRDTIQPFPTFSEAIFFAARDLDL
jgi:pyruvate/2-oxoglutarate dehydrogenase complex dihydrolipoamide dehydrogenase (E3) component